MVEEEEPIWFFTFPLVPTILIYGAEWYIYTQPPSQSPVYEEVKDLEDGIPFFQLW